MPALGKELVGKICTAAYLTRDLDDFSEQIVTQNDLIMWQ